MIDISLTEQPVNTDSFNAFDEKLPCLFLGFAIKNEYDNQRLEICGKYNPKRRLFIFENKDGFSKINEEFSVLPLYGLFLPLNTVGAAVAKTLLNQEVAGNMNINIYETILDEHNMSCKDAYSYLNKRVYPVDFKHFKKITNDSIRDDNKILQHLLNLNEDKFDFQKFGAFKLLILV
jgi:hypothetical protein